MGGIRKRGSNVGKTEDESFELIKKFTQKETVNLKCPNCGGILIWGIKKQKFVCESCSTAYTEAALNQAQPKRESDTQQSGIDWQTIKTLTMDEIAKEQALYVCESCGAEIIGDQHLATTTCPYCDSAIVLKGRVSGQNQPDYILPFKISREEAVQKLKDFYTCKPILPRRFTKRNVMHDIKSIYIPFWLVDASITGTKNYAIERTRTRKDLEKAESIKRQYDHYGKSSDLEIDYYEVIKTGSVDFEKIPVDASKKMPNQLMDSIEPYDYTALKSFDIRYLSGFLANQYDETLKESETRADVRMQKTLEKYLDTSMKRGITNATELDSFVGRINHRQGFKVRKCLCSDFRYT